MVRWQIWQRVTGSWVTVTGKRRERELLITSMMPSRRSDLAVRERLGEGLRAVEADRIAESDKISLRNQ
jgi:hypothetical protein